MPEASQWQKIIEADPSHSHRYRQRWIDMAAQGRDLWGEARLIDAMAERGSRILDAGCGTGRIGGWLHDRGHQVVGVDLDPVLIDAARTDHPEGDWRVGDLAELEPDESGFDLIVSAGNVMTFLAESTRADVVARLAANLRPGARMVIGFGAGRGYPFDDFLRHLTQAGLDIDACFSSWDLRPFGDASDFVVAIASRPA
ncbi:class I SAM-dependent methyltransferase [Parenemella sanctibonifatiensis]|uniref:SAM-dependent methyltransferase n=1 Tax=Parenemella sanctibonifatiensis TaxID=2016505 RepID=A0A255ENE2_9ACTN|nr:class I SAM-dependent methyltransferase [Parenemella sanctibonifatiensis]OYN92481.1 SAM-dependent methyltransferase [Parenemella sanctibonifatiensis]